MPLVKIEMMKGRNPRQKKLILDGIHQALVDSIKIPVKDRKQRIYELEPEDFEVGSYKKENYLLIEITMFKGRSLEAKKLLYKKIVSNLTNALGIEGNEILIVLYEPPLENWGIRGGQLASDVNLGYKIDI